MKTVFADVFLLVGVVFPSYFLLVQIYKFSEVRWSLLYSWIKFTLEQVSHYRNQWRRISDDDYWSQHKLVIELYSVFRAFPRLSNLNVCCVFFLWTFLSSLSQSFILCSHFTFFFFCPQKMTWKSRQADVDTCRMKGKHKVEKPQTLPCLHL